MSTPALQPGTAAGLRRLLNQPYVGFAPWIVLALVEGPNRVVLAAALAGGLAVVTTTVGLAIGVRPKLLDVTAIVFFGLLAIWAALAGPDTSRWLGVWAGELSNAAIALLAAISLAVRKPFTLQYARESTPREYWGTAVFLRVNNVITAMWTAVFAIIALVGYLGDGPLHQPDNLWTNWLIPIALVVLAVKFTGWYPDFATADRKRDASTGALRADLFRPLAAYLVPVGIIVMVLSDKEWWVGAAIAVVGVLVTRKLHQTARPSSPNRPDLQ